MTTFDRATASDEGDLSPAELADVCEALIVAWHANSTRSRQGAAEDSASDLAANSIRAQFSENLPHNLEYAHGQMAGQMVDAIVLQLQSVVTLLRAEPMIPLGLWPLVRSEIECAGRVAWLLEPFPGVDVGRLRVARGILEHLAAIQRQRFTAGEWNKPRAKQFKEKCEELLERIRLLFDDVYLPLDKLEEIDEWRIGDQTMLPLGRSVSLFLGHLSNGAGLCDVFSDNSHPLGDLARVPVFAGRRRWRHVDDLPGDPESRQLPGKAGVPHRLQVGADDPGLLRVLGRFAQAVGRHCSAPLVRVSHGLSDVSAMPFSPTSSTGAIRGFCRRATDIP